MLAEESRKPPRDRTRPSTACFEMFLPETGPLSGYRQMSDIFIKRWGGGSTEGLQFNQQNRDARNKTGQEEYKGRGPR